MKCITLWQPWASLILWGEKKIETRSWATQHRGLLAIHSAAKDHPTLAAICATEPFRTILARHGIREFKELPRRTRKVEALPRRGYGWWRAGGQLFSRIQEQATQALAADKLHANGAKNGVAGNWSRNSQFSGFGRKVC
jgi:hypothetical protein